MGSTFSEKKAEWARSWELLDKEELHLLGTGAINTYYPKNIYLLSSLGRKMGIMDESDGKSLTEKKKLTYLGGPGVGSGSLTSWSILAWRT